MAQQQTEKSAFLAIVGRPNVGKSSLLNSLLGQKVAIVSQKPQTTRTRVTGVCTEGTVQLVFLDTPGLLKPHSRLGEYMVRSVTESVAGVDAAVLVAEAGHAVSPSALELIEKFGAQKLRAVLAINKIDLLPDKSVLMRQIAEFSQLYPFEAVVPVSAKTGNGVKDLRDELKKLAQAGPHFFDEDTLTDQPERVIASEIIREKLLRLLNREVPHGTAVVVETMRERGGKIRLRILPPPSTVKKNPTRGSLLEKAAACSKKSGLTRGRTWSAFSDAESTCSSGSR